MFKNFLLVAWRNIGRHKGFSAVNIFGLTVSLAVGLLVIQILANFFSYDRFHEKKDRLYRVVTTKSSAREQRTFASAPLPLSPALIQEAPAVEKTTRIKTGFSGNAVFQEKVLRITGMFADPEFLDMFSFRLERGDPAAALTSPQSIVLTKQAAGGFFGESNPIGRTLLFKEYGDFLVTGVLEDQRNLKSQFPEVCLLSFSSLPLLESQNKIPSSLAGWENFADNYVYLLLRKNARPSQVTSLFPRWIKRHYSGSEYAYDFRLQSLTDVIPGEPLENHMGISLAMSPIYAVSLFSLVLLLASSFNYTNLSMARAFSRAREVGVRRVVGATRLQIFVQFLGETMLLALIALILAYPIYRGILIPLIWGMEPELREFFIFQDQPKIIASFILLAVLTGVTAGVLPAFSISAFKPVIVLKRLFNIRLSSRVTLKKTMIVIQFALSLVFIISGIIAYHQDRYVRKIDPGFSPDQIINIELSGADYKIFEREISSFSQILGVSASSHLPGRTSLASFQIKKTFDADPIVFRGLSVDPNFLDNLRMKLIAGRNLPETIAPAAVPQLLINETAARALGWPQSRDAVGQKLIFQDGASAQIIGVVKDFSTSSLFERIEPCLLKYDPQSFRFTNIRIPPDKLQDVKGLLEKAWQNLHVAQPLEFQTYEDQIRDRVADLAVTMKIIAFIAVLTIIISCLGLLGIANYSAVAKTKEIGIRKVVGASRTNIIHELTKEYAALLGLSAGFGLPVSIWINQSILRNYARHIALRWEFFVLGLAVVAVLGLSVVLSQAVKAALASPVDSLRYE